MSRWKKFLLHVWEQAVRFAKWSEAHGIPKELVVFLLQVLLWLIIKA